MNIDLSSLNPRTQEVYRTIEKEQSITPARLAELLGVKKRALWRHVSILNTLGYIWTIDNKYYESRIKSRKFLEKF